MFYVSEQESFSAGGIYTTARFIKTGIERGGDGRKRYYDHGTDLGIPNRLLRGTLLADDERVGQSQGGNGKSH